MDKCPDSDLINRLLNETLEKVSASSYTHNKRQLREYFLKKEANTQMAIQEMELNNICFRDGVTFIRLNYAEKLSCFELDLGEQKFIFPKNWSLFERFGSTEDLVLLRLEESFSLWRVLNSVMPEYNDFIFCYMSLNLYLITGDTMSENSVNEFRDRLKVVA